MTIEFEEYLRKKLKSPRTYSDHDPDSILTYDILCNCDDGFFCHHRLQWLMDTLRNPDHLYTKEDYKDIF